MSVTKEDNGTFTAQCRIQEWDGRTVHKKKRGFKRKRDAVQWEQEMLSRGNQIDMTVREFAEHYFEDKKVDLKLRTIEHKRDVLQTHVFPYFGNRKMETIRASDLIEWQKVMLGKGYKLTYLHDIQKHFSALFTHAVKVYDLPENPFRKISQMGKSEAAEMSFWTLDEYERFLRQMEPGTQYYVLFEILFWTGMRIGELLALTKRDIDTINQRITINKTYYRMNKQDVITEPKTEQSVRTIEVPAFLVDELTDYMDRLYGLQDDDRVFPIVIEAVQHKLKREIEKGGLKKIRVHDFRHSHAAYLIEQGVEPLVIKERLGHKDIRITLNTYGHLYPSKQKALAQMLDEKRKGSDRRNGDDKEADCLKSGKEKHKNIQRTLHER